MSDPASQNWNVRQYADNARFVTDLGAPVVELLAPRPGERILDLGCGDGPLTAKLAALGCEVVGVDGSPAMIAAARALGLDARVVDGQALNFDGEFDAVFSNAALHWMKRGEAVIAGVWRALKPGGRFVGEFGGRGNVGGIVKAANAARVRRRLAAVSPWFNPGPDEYATMLEAQGFQVTTMLHFPRPTPLPGSVREWLETFASAFLQDVGDVPQFLDEVVEALRPKLCDGAGTWSVDYVRLRFAARRP
jgi:trans-aconitate methyltransferase